MRIRENLIAKPNELQNSPESTDAKVSAPELSQYVKLDNPENLHGLAECIVAVESLAFLARELNNLRPQLQNLLPSDQWPALDHFYSQVNNYLCSLMFRFLMINFLGVCSRGFKETNLHERGLACS
jgi:Protein of unknown function C-terminus (DUF2451)